MSDFLVALSSWLHTLATIVMIGYYFFAALIYQPIFERQMQADALRELLEQVSARLRPFFGASLLIFLLTGTHLMLINEDYPGLGHFFANPWSVLIVVKHVLILAFLALAIYSERAFLSKVCDERPEALTQFHRALNINTAFGMIIILITSIARIA
jgi:uncharacterized membrane protein